MKQQYIGTHKVYLLPSGAYNVRIRIGDKRYSLTASTLRELRQQVEDFETTGPHITLHSFGESVDDYIETCELHGHSPSTLMAYRHIRRCCLGDLDAMPTEKVTALDVQRAVNAYARSHSPKSVRNMFGLVHKVLSITRPGLDLRQIILPRPQHTANADAGIVIPDDEMIGQLLAYTKEHDVELYKAILLAAMTGLRRSELCALTWSDINMDFCCITVDKATVMGSDMAYHTKAPKSSAGQRTNPLPKSLVNILREYAGAPDDPVVNLTPNVLTYRYCRLRDKLHIPGRFHDLRHYHASVMVALGIP